MEIKHIKISKYTIPLLSLIVCCIGGFMDVHGQPSSPTYMSFSYVKVNPGKTATYLNLIKNYSPKITGERIRQGGGVLGWYMYEVRMPSGAANEYDFVSITATSEFNLLFDELAPPDGTMERLLPGISSMTINDIFSQYEDSRTVLRKEVIVPVSSLISGGSPHKVAWVDFVKVAEGKEKEFLKMETETILPSYQELVSKGLITNCRMYKKTLPLNMNSDFDVMIVYFANDISSLADGRLLESLKKISTAKAPTAPALGKVTRSEIWQLIEYMDVEKSKQ